MSEIDEAELLGAGQRGTVLDGMAEGRRRVVQAAVLRRCCHELKDDIDPRGLRLARVLDPRPVPGPVHQDRVTGGSPPAKPGCRR